MRARTITVQNKSMPTIAKTMNVAFLGGAFDSAVGRAHRAAIELDQRFELVSGCFSRSLESSQGSAIKYGISPERAYGSIDNLLSAELNNLDAIVILTPQDQHGAQVQTCLDAGIPVICEKALVGSVDEAITIQDKIQTNGGFLAVTYNYTGYPIIRELRYMIQQGRLGKIQQIQIEMPQEGFSRLSSDGLPLSPQAWRLTDLSIPTLSLDLGVHVHMMIAFLTGETPIELVATTNTYGNFKTIKDSVSCIANYSNELTCNVWYTKCALGNRNGLKLRVFGDLGSAEWLQERPEHLHMADKSGNRLTIDRSTNGIEIANQTRYTRFKAGHPAGFIEAFANYYYDVADALENHQLEINRKNEYVFGIDQSIEGLRMLSAISDSSKNKRWESLV